MSDPLSVLAGIAGVAAVGVQLSLSLYEISNRLINAPKEVAEVASELSSLATILELFGSTLESSKRMLKKEMEDTARETVARFEMLQKDIVEIITKASHIKHLRWLFTSSRVRDLMAKVHTVKSSLQLLLSIIQLAIAVKSGSKRTRRRNHQTDQKDLESYHRRLAESFAEATRQTIKELFMQQILEQRSSQQELLAFRHWTEPTGQTAAWLYHRTLSTAVRGSPTGFQSQRAGHARTVKTHNPDAVASDSDSDDGSNTQSDSTQANADQYLDCIPEDEEEQLFRTSGLGKKVVDSLLHQWTNLSEQQIMESGNATSFSKPAVYQDSIEKMIRATIKDELDSGQGFTSWRQSLETKAGSFVDENCSKNKASSETFPPKRTSLASLKGLTIQPSGLIKDGDGVTVGKLAEGNAKKLSRKYATCDEQGNIWLDSKRVGRVEAWNIGRDKEIMENLGYPEAPEVPGPYSPPPSYPGAALGGQIAIPPSMPATSNAPAQILPILRSSSPTSIDEECGKQLPLQKTDQSGLNELESTNSKALHSPKKPPQTSEITDTGDAPDMGNGSTDEELTDELSMPKVDSEGPGHDKELQSSKSNRILGTGRPIVRQIEGEVEEYDTEENSGLILKSGDSLDFDHGNIPQHDGKSGPATPVSAESSDKTLVNDVDATEKQSHGAAVEDDRDDVARKVKFDYSTSTRPQVSTPEASSPKIAGPFTVSGLTYSGIDETIIEVVETSQDKGPAATASIFSLLAGKPVDIFGEVYDDNARLIGRLSEGNVADFAGNGATCDAEGNVWCAGKVVKGAKIAVIEENPPASTDPHIPKIQSECGPSKKSQSSKPKSRKSRHHDTANNSVAGSTISMRHPTDPDSSSAIDLFYDPPPNFGGLTRSNSISQFDPDWAVMPYHPFGSYPSRQGYYPYHPAYHNQGRAKNLPPPLSSVAPSAPNDHQIAPLKEQLVALQIQKQQHMARAKEREHELQMREVDLQEKLRAKDNDAEQERRNRKVETIERILEEQQLKAVLASREAEARSRAMVAEDAAKKAKGELEDLTNAAKNAADAHRRAIELAEEKIKQAIKEQECGIKLTQEEAERARKALIQDYEAKLKAEAEAKCKAETAQTEAEAARREAEDAQKEAERKVYHLRNAQSQTETIPTPSQIRYASLLNPTYTLGEQSSSAATSDSGSTVTDDVSEATETTQTTPRTRSGIVEVNQADLEADPSQRIIFPRRVGWKEHEFKTLTKSMSRFGFWPLQEKDAEVPCVPSQFYEMPGSGGCGLRGTALWHPPGPTLASDLYTSLLKTGWKPTYVRCNEYGETWFLGRQPVHVIMFTVNYIPQATIDDPSQHNHQYAEEGKLYISKEWVEKDTLDELGYGYSILPDWRVSLDPKLTHADIETAVARSFLLRETRLRKKYRDFAPSGSSSIRRIEEVGSDFGDARSSSGSLSSVNKPWRLRSLMSRSNSRASGAFQS